MPDIETKMDISRNRGKKRFYNFESTALINKIIKCN